MASVEELLLENLNDLKKEELKNFLWLLSKRMQMPKCKFENAEKTETVDMMVSYFGQKDAVNTTVKILRKMNQNNLAEQLENSYKQAQDKDNKKTSAPAAADSYLGSISHTQTPVNFPAHGTQLQPLIQTTPVGIGTNAPGTNAPGTNAPGTNVSAFIKSKPKAFGSVQIAIGLLTLLLGIVAAMNSFIPSLVIVLGLPFWGSLIFIIAGSLSIAAENNRNSSSIVCLVRGSLGMNIVTAITAGISIIVTSVDLVIRESFDPFVPPLCSHGYECHFNPIMHYDHKFFMGTNIVFLIFTILEFVISIYLSAFGCKATCTPQAQLPQPTGVQTA